MSEAVPRLGLPLRHPAALIATAGGVGLLPLAPGTWASLAALPCAWAIEAFTTHQWITVQRSPQHHPLDARHVKGARAGG